VINVHFGGLSDYPRYVEIGEPPAGTIGPAIANAVFQATGKRMRSTPFRLHDLSWA
jgi:isoquinoline 1-oxidoreductase beta subunit